MLEPQTTIDWAGSLLWLAGIAIAAFLVSWVSTNLLHVRRVAYVGVLAGLTACLTAGYLVWSDAAAEFWLNGWAWGIAGAVAAGGLLALGVNRAPMGERHPRPIGALDLAWDAVVYGASEGLLLSVLPVVVTWQAFSAAGWTGGWASIGAGAAAMGASAAVIVTHHLGYEGYRSRMMIFPVVGCLLLSLSYLVTGSPVAAMGGHMILHAAMMRRGVELPPEESGLGPVAEAAG